MLSAELDAQPMGSRVPPRQGEATLTLELHGHAPIEELELIRSGALTTSIKLQGSTLDIEHSFRLVDLSEGEYVYVRIRQNDGGLAWSSPWFITENESGAWRADSSGER